MKSTVKAENVEKTLLNYPELKIYFAIPAKTSFQQITLEQFKLIDDMRLSKVCYLLPICSSNLTLLNLIHTNLNKELVLQVEMDKIHEIKNTDKVVEIKIDDVETILKDNPKLNVYLDSTVFGTFEKYCLKDIRKNLEFVDIFYLMPFENDSVVLQEILDYKSDSMIYIVNK